MSQSEQPNVERLMEERDELRGVAQRWMARTELAEAEANRLRAAIEDYRLWEPRKAGHADAYARLMAVLGDSSGSRARRAPPLTAASRQHA